MTFKEFLDIYSNAILPKKPKHIRAGQSLMNLLRSVDKELYSEVRDKSDYAGTFTITGYDCFFYDDVIPLTLKYIKKNWKENNKTKQK